MSKPLVVAVPHHLGQAEALRRLKDGIDHTKKRYAPTISVLQDTWTDNRLDFRVSALGQTASGSLDVTEDQVVCTVLLPWVLAMIADKAKRLIQKEGTLLLDKK